MLFMSVKKSAPVREAFRPLFSDQVVRTHVVLKQRSAPFGVPAFLYSYILHSGVLYVQCICHNKAGILYYTTLCSSTACFLSQQLFETLNVSFATWARAACWDLGIDVDICHCWPSWK